MMKFMIVGARGTSKNAVGKHLADALGYPIFSAGDYIHAREVIVSSDTDLSKIPKRREEISTEADLRMQDFCKAHPSFVCIGKRMVECVLEVKHILLTAHFEERVKRFAAHSGMEYDEAFARVKAQDYLDKRTFDIEGSDKTYDEVIDVADRSVIETTGYIQQTFFNNKTAELR